MRRTVIDQVDARANQDNLDNQRAVTVKSTFLQNRSYLDFYYREAFTVVEMEAGPFLSAM